MKLRKTFNILVLTLAFIMVFAGCSKKEETKGDKTEETTTETTAAEEDDDESDLGYIDEDLEPDPDMMNDSLCYSVGEEQLPDQNIEIDEEYYKFYDYSKINEPMDYEYNPATADDFENEALKAVAQEYIDKGFELVTAEDNAKFYTGTGYFDEETGWGVAYLFNGFSGGLDSGDTYTTVEVYVVPEADLTEVLKLKLVSEDDKTATFKDGGAGYCPREGQYTYDKETEILVYEESFDYSGAVG